MPFSKFRRSEASSVSLAGSTVQVESVEVVRKRAKHRLIGASVLVVVGVVVFPLLFDTQPRPAVAGMPIEIPGKDAVKPLPAAAPRAEGKNRSVVQIGAFADASKAHEARLKIEKAGFKTYTQIITSAEGQRIRVRIGPFPTKEEADKVGEKIKALDFEVVVLTF